ncbi:tetraspanin-8 isoform X2 [Nematostella vectensis]|uniref:tetraspanin-8 isoform X2 n=1 Tax=Nematostella vectensis TaxID=45351 RepID=UPI0020772197|nr:tetraspanin-8 isoform X2 [Nematostella vectensis]
MTKYTEAPPAIKWVVITIHFIFLIFGIILISVGAWVEIHAGPHSDISAFNVLAGNRVLMFTGCVLALVSLAGIVAATINSKVFLIIVFVLLVITLSFEIAGIIVAWDNQAKINRSILADLKNRIKNFPGPGTRVVDSIQERLQCCGADSGPNDWMNNKHFVQSVSVPDSCCKQEYREKDCGLGQIIANTRIHTEVLTMPLTLLMFCKIKEIE